MLVPRRVRRRLVLPPGWVALGFLLLLGCQALQLWGGQLKPLYVMEITMPTVHVAKAMHWNDMCYLSINQLNRLRPWNDVEFKGVILPDFLNAATTESAIRKIIADTSHAGGVRVRFLPGATYANLVKVLDIMNYTNQKKYWLDIHHQPSTLYAITDKLLPKGKSRFDLCYLCGDVIMSSPMPVRPTLHQLVVEIEQEVENLKNHTWRLPIVLLVLISGLSLWRLTYHKPGH